MSGVPPDERRRELLATVGSVLSLVPGVRIELDGLDLAVRTDGLSGDGDSAEDSDAETAIVDRIEDGTAVVLFEDGGEQRTVSEAVLPETAREEGTVLRVPDGEALALATVDRTETRERRESLQDRVDDLAEPVPERS